MSTGLIYTDACHPETEKMLHEQLGLRVLLRMKEKEWNVNDSLSIITTPSLKLAVFNKIDEIVLLESSLLQFLCKPILITSKAIKEYTILQQVVNYIDFASNLSVSPNAFISWYNSCFLGDNQ